MYYTTDTNKQIHNERFSRYFTKYVPGFTEISWNLETKLGIVIKGLYMLKQDEEHFLNNFCKIFESEINTIYQARSFITSNYGKNLIYSLELINWMRSSGYMILLEFLGTITSIFVNISDNFTRDEYILNNFGNYNKSISNYALYNIKNANSVNIKKWIGEYLFLTLVRYI